MIGYHRILSVFSQLETIAGSGSPVCACVVDEHGFVLGYTQMDNMSSRSFGMARAKACTAARMGQTTAQFHDRLQRDQLTLADFGEEFLTSVQGGVPVFNRNHQLIGGVAVSGRRPDEDETLALLLSSLLME